MRSGGETQLKQKMTQGWIFSMHGDYIKLFLFRIDYLSILDQADRWVWLILEIFTSVN